jgi:hypothetical protein
MLHKIRRGKFIDNGSVSFAPPLFYYPPEKLLVCFHGKDISFQLVVCPNRWQRMAHNGIELSRRAVLADCATLT